MSDRRRAEKLFRQFREESPSRTKRVPFRVPKAVAVIGDAEFIGYVTTHNGKAHLYIHEFAPGSRPRLAAGARRNQLFLVGGRYRVGARGIVDLDSQGRPILEAPPRYKVTLTGRGR